jgi:hypothetical protein
MQIRTAEKESKDVEIFGCRFRKFGKGLSDYNCANSRYLYHRDITQNAFLKIKTAFISLPTAGKVQRFLLS